MHCVPVLRDTFPVGDDLVAVSLPQSQILATWIRHSGVFLFLAFIGTSGPAG